MTVEITEIPDFPPDPDDTIASGVGLDEDIDFPEKEDYEDS